jgi:hypothetical protein
MNSKLAISLLVLGLVAGSSYYYWFKQEPAVPTQPAAIVAIPAIEEPEPEINFPVEEIVKVPAPTPTVIEEPLPNLAQSDAAISEWLAGVADSDLFEDLLVREQIIPRIVATVDNLTSDQVSPKISPTKAVAGKFAVGGDSNAMILDSGNYSRYDKYLALTDLVKTDLLVTRYVRYYPLFQEAYEALGYPDLYFNDRLVEVIDHLLQTPEPNGPIYLIKPEAFYLYADPALERLSGGQKILLRMGPENATAVKLKLGSIRDRINGRSAM